jgi:hypothetical protein
LNKVDAYRQQLRETTEWDSFLMAESRLPGPRGNLELACAVAEEGTASLFWRYVQLDAEQAPVNTPQEFLAFCGTLGLGKLFVAGDEEALTMLRRQANDPRWRIREAVAMALQRWGEADMEALLAEMSRWSIGSLLERRAAVAALCEPKLLAEPGHVVRVLEILDGVTSSLLEEQDRRSEAFRALRKGLGYCWSVAVAVHPAAGKAAMVRWLDSADKDVRWVMRENLRKARLARMDAAWVTAALAQLGRGWANRAEAR